MEVKSDLEELDEREVPIGWWSADDAVFLLGLDFLREFAERLRTLNYRSLQYVPIRYSLDALTSEYKNLRNLILPKWHRLFHSSVFPSLYIRRLERRSEALAVCMEALFLNRPVCPELLKRYLGRDLIDQAIENKFMQEKNGLVTTSFSFVPVDNYILLRDRFDLYETNDVQNRRYRVSLGSDSIPFAKFVRHFLADRRFDRSLEIGSGSGIQSLVASESCNHCVAVDYNERAVRFTEINSALNEREKIDTRFSNLYSNVDGDFDVILANPWFCELRTGGLEEVPGILSGLKTHLRDGGFCLLMLNSFVQGKSNPVVTHLKEFAFKERYDIDLYTLNYGLESIEGLKEWKTYGISHSVCYNAVLRNGGKGIVQVHDVQWLRKVVQFGKMHAYRLQNRL